MLRTLAIAASLALVAPAIAQDAAAGDAQSPNDIVAAAPQSEWVAIAPEDLLVMTLAPDRDGNAREVVIQLMPEPFSQGWVENIRTLARANWYDGVSINRVQDNYVVQWGDPNYDNPEAEGAAKPLPDGLNVMGEEDYVVHDYTKLQDGYLAALKRQEVANGNDGENELTSSLQEAYPGIPFHFEGWPAMLGLAGLTVDKAYPVHCYGMVGVGRGMSPDTGSGAELYTVIGHAPRHLDRNIALIGRVVAGMEHLSSFPRGSGTLGFYTEDEADKRTPIRSIRVAADLPGDEQPTYEYLSTESETFARYAEARANRRDPFFIVPAGGADICNIPVPVRERG